MLNLNGNNTKEIETWMPDVLFKKILENSHQSTKKKKVFQKF